MGDAHTFDFKFVFIMLMSWIQALIYSFAGFIRMDSCDGLAFLRNVCVRKYAKLNWLDVSKSLYFKITIRMTLIGRDHKLGRGRPPLVSIRGTPPDQNSVEKIRWWIKLFEK